MESQCLFSAVYRKIGWGMFFSFLILGILYWTSVLSDVWTVRLFGLEQRVSGAWRLGGVTTGLLMIIVMSALVLSLIFIAFSREADEDECMVELRNRALTEAVYVYVVLLLWAVLFLYETALLYFMVANIYLLLLLFAFRFRYSVRRFRKSGKKCGIIFGWSGPC